MNRPRCDNCKRWLKHNRKWLYHLMTLTEWLPPPGIDPKMREFKCESCNHKIYVVLTPLELAKMGVKEYAYAFTDSR